MAPEKAKQVIEQQLGKPIDDVFAWIDLKAPLGSASIAQVGLAHEWRPIPFVLHSNNNNNYKAFQLIVGPVPTRRV